MNADILGAMITPVVLLSGTGLFLLTTNNRFSRVIDRIRALDALVERLAGEEPSERTMWLAQRYRAQLDIFTRRGNFLRRALISLHAGFALFLAASLALALLVPFGATHVPAVVLACVGMGCLFYAALLVTIEIKDCFTAVEIDLEIGRRAHARLAAHHEAHVHGRAPVVGAE